MNIIKSFLIGFFLVFSSIKLYFVKQNDLKGDGGIISAKVYSNNSNKIFCLGVRHYPENPEIVNQQTIDLINLIKKFNGLVLIENSYESNPINLFKINNGMMGEPTCLQLLNSECEKNKINVINAEFRFLVDFFCYGLCRIQDLIGELLVIKKEIESYNDAGFEGFYEYINARIVQKCDEFDQYKEFYLSDCIKNQKFIESVEKLLTITNFSELSELDKIKQLYEFLLQHLYWHVLEARILHHIINNSHRNIFVVTGAIHIVQLACIYEAAKEFVNLEHIKLIKEIKICNPTKAINVKEELKEFYL